MHRINHFTNNVNHFLPIAISFLYRFGYQKEVSKNFIQQKTNKPWSSTHLSAFRKSCYILYLIHPLSTTFICFSLYALSSRYCQCHRFTLVIISDFSIPAFSAAPPSITSRTSTPFSALKSEDNSSITSLP